MSVPALPLLDIFHALRAAGLPLGTADYLDLLRALTLGEGLSGREELLALCQMLWATSVAEQALCARLFDQAMDRARGRAIADREAEIRRAAELPPKREDPKERRGDVDRDGERTEERPRARESEGEESAEMPLSIRRVELKITTADVAAGDLLTTAAELSPDEYLPVRGRQMATSWRQLRRLVARGPKTEVDVGATIGEVGRTGVFLGPSLRGRRVNAAGLVLLLDQQGSMAPFHPFTRALRDSAERSSGLGRVDVALFKNYAYPNVSVGGRTVPLRSHLAAFPRGMGALVVSDAGAARGRHSTPRVERTLEMLRILHEGGRRVAWLNPVPEDRWDGTSAGSIAHHVSMFAADRAGLDAALRLLRGRRPVAHASGRP